MKNVLLTLLFVAVAWISFSFGKQQLQKPKIVFPLPVESTTTTTVTTKVLVGNDKDSHGCIISAGYTWCQIKNKCLRTWEEPCKITTTTTTATTTTKPAIVGGDKDSHGCIPSAGYTWCEIKNKCLRTWEEACIEDPTCRVENCHGFDIKCGSNPPQMCTMEYALGDKCLSYAKCSVQNGKCQQLVTTEFTNCKTCVQNCITLYQNDSFQAFQCESLCK